MNKKQLIVAWVMGIYIAITSVSIYAKVYFERGLKENMFFDLIPPRTIFFRINSILYVPLTLMLIPILIIGGLLIYTLRDKKK